MVKYHLYLEMSSLKDFILFLTASKMYSLSPPEIASPKPSGKIKSKSLKTPGLLESSR